MSQTMSVRFLTMKGRNIMDNETILFDRLEIIKTMNIKHDLEHNSYLSFSGGKDSTFLHYLLDMAIPNNNIPRVYVDTGISYQKINEFVYNMAKTDKRIIIVKPKLPIKQTLEKYGYPFKSKHHSYMLEKYQRLGMIYGVKNYLGVGENKVKRECPQKLKYQFSDSFNIRISDLCCLKMKEEPMIQWQKENNKTIAITGIMADEEGRRKNAQCFISRNKKQQFFNPLSKVTKEFEEWFIQKYNIQLCDLYYEPFNFHRTGCMGCPFAIEIQDELDKLQKELPIERRRCEIIWKPIYDEYRRIGYRLRKEDYDPQN